MIKHILRKARHLALTTTEGIFSTTIDIALWSIVFLGDLTVPQKRSGNVWRAQIAADQFLHQYNYDTIKQAIINAKRRGLVKRSRHHAWPEITKQGKKRLMALIPQYDQVRKWDNRLHFVTYDIPEKKRSDRDLLREYLRRIGCGMLQESVWLTPYNPIDILRTFIEEKALAGTIVVSDIGKDGSVGEEDVTSMVVRVFKLEKLNNRYEEWLSEIDKNGLDHWMLMGYLSILRDDPQLPFSLLPSWWKGDRAYQKVRPLFERVLT